MAKATAIVAKTSSAVSGLDDVSLRRLDTELMPVQKKRVTGSPSVWFVGTSGVDVRSPAIHRNGSSHCRFMFGPVGPFETPASCRPQCPSYASHANSESNAGCVGTMIGVGATRVDGSRVSSQPSPDPCCPLPRKSADQYWLACEPDEA